MIMTCELCGSDFLTEADPYVVRPTPQGYKHYCSCMIVNHNQISGVDKIKKENAKLYEALKFYAKEENWKGKKPYYWNSIDPDDLSDCHLDDDEFDVPVTPKVGGKTARQVLKELEGK